MTRRDLIKRGWYAIPAMALGFAETSEAGQHRRRFHRAQQRRTGPRRLGMATFSCEIIESLTPQMYQAMHRAQYEPSPESLDELRKALLLPGNCRIDAVSPHYLFRNRQVVLRIECDDFPETSEACMILSIDPWYTVGSDGLPQFDGWGDAAVANKAPLRSKGA